MTTTEKFARKLLTVQNLMDLGAHKRAATLLNHAIDMVCELPKEEQLQAVTKCEEMAVKGVALEQAAEALKFS